MLATTPSGSWPIRSVHAAVGEDRLVLRRRARPRRGRSRCGRESRSIRCAIAPSACRPPGVRVRASVSSSAATARRKRAIAIARLRERRRLPRGLRRARALRLGGDAGGVVGRHFGERRAVGGVDDLQGLHAVLRGACRGEEVVEKRRVVERAFAAAMELGVPLHRGHVAGPGRRIASIMPSTGQRASTTKPGARSLIAWWWTLLTTAAPTPCEDLRQPRARHELDRVDVAVVDLGVAVLERAAAAACRCPAAACRRTRRSSAARRGRRRAPACRARRRRASSADLVVVADAVAAPLRLQRRLAVARRRDVGAALEDERVEPVARSRRA